MADVTDFPKTPPDDVYLVHISAMPDVEIMITASMPPELVVHFQESDGIEINFHGVHLCFAKKNLRDFSITRKQ